MAGAIEHRDIVNLMQSYDNYNCVNFTIWQGKDLKVTYEDGDQSEAKDLLSNFLETIRQSSTTAVYTLKVYKGDGPIKQGTTPHGSTTFQLTSYVPANGQQNTKETIYVNPGQLPQKVAGTDRTMVDRLDKLERENRELLERLHTTQLDNLRAEMKAQIAGLAMPQEKTGWEKIGELLIENKDTVKEVLGSIISVFRPEKNFIVQQAASQISGTRYAGDQSQPEETTTMSETQTVAGTDTDVKRTADGALVNPFIQGDALNKSAEDQAAITKGKIIALGEDLQGALIEDCLAIVEERIGTETTARMMLALACMTNKSLNQVLSYLE